MSIIVQVSDRSWTMQAVHLACAMASNTESKLVLLELWPVTNAGLLGTGIGANAPHESSSCDLEAYEMIAEDYGVPLVKQPMECESLQEAAVQAVEILAATALFMHVPERRFPFWRRLHIRHLQHRLNRLNCHLYLCDQPAQPDPWVAAINTPAMRHL